MGHVLESYVRGRMLILVSWSEGHLRDSVTANELDELRKKREAAVGDCDSV